MKRQLGLPVLFAAILSLAAPPSLHAATLQFSHIGSGDQGLQQFWQLTPDEVQRYRNIMAATGDRYKNSNPLMVLSMMADSKEDRDYYAKKAAEMEHALVMREIETAWLVSEHMSEARLTEQMTLLTDTLTGLNTTQPMKDDTAWQPGDELVLFIDGGCLTAGCIGQFSERIRRAPDNIPRRLIIRAKEPLSGAAQTIVESWPETVIQNYDPVEHGRFLNVRNQAPNVVLHVRDRNIIEILTEQLPSATAASASAPAAPAANPPVSTTTSTASSAAASNTSMTSKPDTSVTRNSSAQSATNGATPTEKKTPVKSATDNKTTKKGNKS